LHWNYGDPVSLTLRWAKDSPFVPAIPSSAAGPSPRVDGDSVSWTFKDGWSLIRFIQTFNAGPAFEQPFLLAFNIPEKPASVSSEKLQTQTITSARVFVRLLVSPPGAKETIAKAGFPVSAPPLPKSLPERAKGQ
ncbi:MAG TPA: hypothetical protein VFE22_01370, partial [Edaphobacter sp.]|nr:hypothetical protein [Edaphobacter sp.]